MSFHPISDGNYAENHLRESQRDKNGSPTHASAFCKMGIRSVEFLAIKRIGQNTGSRSMSYACLLCIYWLRTGPDIAPAAIRPRFLTDSPAWLRCAEVLARSPPAPASRRRKPSTNATVGSSEGEIGTAGLARRNPGCGRSVGRTALRDRVKSVSAGLGRPVAY